MATYHVAKTGNNDDPGSEAEPWLTIQKAADTMVAGDICYIHVGTYAEIVTPAASGESENWITYENYESDVVTLDGDGIDFDTAVFYINGKSYISVEGLRCVNATTGSGAAGIRLNGECHHITLKDCYTYNTDNSGIIALYSWTYTPDKVTYLTIDGCEIDHACVDGSNESISLIYVNHFEIKDCYVHDVQGSKEGIDCKVGSSNGLIHDNEVYNAGLGIYIDSGGYDSHDIDIYNNKLHGQSSGFTFGRESGGTLTDINVYNNLIYENSRGVNFALYNAMMTRCRVFNNTFYGNTQAGVFIAEDSDYFDDCWICNNIIQGGSYLYLIQFYESEWNEEELLIDYNLFYQPIYKDENVYGTNYIKDNPDLTDPENDDFTIQVTSPAINAASATYAPATDYDGTARPQGAADDIGAYEYGEEEYDGRYYQCLINATGAAQQTSEADRGYRVAGAALSGRKTLLVTVL